MTTVKFGAFGKIPSVGDFFRINAPPGFADVWDEWLQRCLVSGAHAYGARWDELYMSVPIWRFCLSAGLAGPGAVLGVLMPSVDRVGRRFPLTLMVPLSEEMTAIRAHLMDTDVFEELETIALSVLDEDISRDALDEKLSALEISVPLENTHCRVAAGSVVACRNADAQKMLTGLTADLLARSFQVPTIWSTTMDGDNRLMVCDGLPDGSNMQGLFDLDAELWREGIL
ncbi:type VI secretion system-associated protein TagF [Marivita sp.]|uniref:type VI secretion system-associated protein TagF n=1 Tax=Marivita sp. TaxID=2003365 RepID=UPI003F6FBABC